MNKKPELLATTTTEPQIIIGATPSIESQQTTEERARAVNLSLDVGCGKQKTALIGIDQSKNSEADLICDAHQLPFRGECFFKVVSRSVIEHSPNPLNFLKEQCRVLKQDGTIEVGTDNAQYFGWSVMNFGRGGDKHWEYMGHLVIFYPENIKVLLRMAGFKVLKTEFVSRKTKLDLIVELLIKLTIWRTECRFHSFKIVATKCAYE